MFIVMTSSRTQNFLFKSILIKCPVTISTGTTSLSIMTKGIMTCSITIRNSTLSKCNVVCVAYAVSKLKPVCWVTLCSHHYTQHNGIQQNPTQHKELIYDNQQNKTLPLCWMYRFICSYAECHYTECCYAECRGIFFLDLENFVKFWKKFWWKENWQKSPF